MNKYLKRAGELSYWECLCLGICSPVFIVLAPFVLAVSILVTGLIAVGKIVDRGYD